MCSVGAYASTPAGWGLAVWPGAGDISSTDTSSLAMSSALTEKQGGQLKSYLQEHFLQEAHPIGLNMTVPSRPAAFARYMAMSASRMTSSGRS